MTTLVDGSVLVTGGTPSGDWNSATNSAELYRPAGDEFLIPPGMPSMWSYRNAHTATALPDGTVVLIGGNEGGDMTLSVEVFDPATLSFRYYLPATERASHTATLLPDGSLLVTGGSVQTDYVGLLRRNLNTAELYLPEVRIPAAKIYTLPGDSGTQGAILHAGSSRLTSQDDPAEAGEIVEIFGGGLAENGRLLPKVSIGGLAAEVLFVGAAPGYRGLFQPKSVS